MNKKELLLRRPSKNTDSKINWEHENGIIVITYPKDFGTIEKWLHNRIGGPELVRRPLDKYTTIIWELIDGENTIKDIVDKFDSKFGEEIAPAAKRVQKFFEKLLELNLIILE